MICWIYILWRVWLKKLCFFFLLINQDNLSLFRKTLGPHFVSSLRKVFHRDEGQIRVSAEKGLWWENVCCASGVSVRVRRSRDFLQSAGIALITRYLDCSRKIWERDRTWRERRKNVRVGEGGFSRWRSSISSIRENKFATTEYNWVEMGRRS